MCRFLYLYLGFIICAREAKADIGLPVADDYDDDDDDDDPGIKCTKLG